MHQAFHSLAAGPNEKMDDVTAIKQVMLDYVWALDTSDWQRLHSLFTDDVTFHTSTMGLIQGAGNLTREFQNRTVHTPVRRHMFASSYARVDQDSALFTCYLIGVRVRPGSPGGDYYWSVGYYRNKLRRTADGWKLSNVEFQLVGYEGNPHMEPSVESECAAQPAVRVMDSLAEAPWGGATSPADATLAPSELIADLYTGFVRAADAGSRTDVAAALDADVTARFGDMVVTGQANVADYLCPPQRSGWRTTFLTNTKIAVIDDTALLGSYVYVNASVDGTQAGHFGGVAVAEVRHTGVGWRITDYRYVPLWDRDHKLLNDRAEEVGGKALLRKLWSIEHKRDRLSPEAEVAQLMTRYTWSYDMNDFDQMSEIFVPETTSSIQMATTSSHVSRDQLLDTLSKVRQVTRFGQHYLFNVDVKMGIDGSSAFLRCYAQTRFRNNDDEVVMVGGTYQLHARRLNGRWRFDTFHYKRAHELVR